MPEEKRKLNYYRLKAGRLEFRLPLRSSRLKDYAPKGGGFQPHPAFGGLKRFTDNDKLQLLTIRSVVLGLL
jgi:hypothetical protein